MTKGGDGKWTPTYPDDIDNSRKIKPNTRLVFESTEAPRSIEQHKCCFGFLKFLFENQDGTDNFNKYRSAILLTLGYTEISFRRLSKGTYEEIEVPMSLSFEKMPQKRFKAFFDDLKDFAKRGLGIDFDEWYKSDWKREDGCQHPDCHQPATDLHEIIPGHYRRQYCIKKGWQVRLCREHHQQSHLIFKDHKESLNIDQFEMFKLHCKILKLDPNKTMKEIMEVKEANPELEEIF